MICEDILPFHISRLNGDEFCYDNEIRYYSDKSRMSGLHFCTRNWYVKTSAVRSYYMQNKSHINFAGICCDEAILKTIAEKSYVKLHSKTKDEHAFSLNRPVHG